MDRAGFNLGHKIWDEAIWVKEENETQNREFNGERGKNITTMFCQMNQLKKKKTKSSYLNHVQSQMKEAMLISLHSWNPG